MGLNKELSDICVISLEQAVAAPYCGLLLAEAGARVIKVERPEGDFARDYDRGANGKSCIFAWLNRGKESICLNLKDKNDLSFIKKIIKHADVLLSNLAPGTLEKLGLINEELRKNNPKLISCKITGYGENEKGFNRKAYDFLVQAESGLCSVTGTESSPTKVGISITDLSTGLTAYSAILRSLINRSKTGKGIDISISMFDVMADWMNMPLLAHRYMGGAPKRMGLKHHFISPYGVFKCGDKGKILLSIQSNREFQSFCENVLKKPELFKNKKFINNPNRNENREELDLIITKVFSKYKTNEVIDILNKYKIANSRLNSVKDLSEHDLLNNGKAKIGNELISLANLPVLSNSQSNFFVPEIGQHTKIIKEEFNNK